MFQVAQPPPRGGGGIGDRNAPESVIGFGRIMHMIQWASTVGPVAAETVEVIMHRKPYPEQGYRAAMGIIRLSDKYGKHRVEQACIYARQLNSENYRTIESVLKNGLEKQPIPKTSSTHQIIEHDNIRGEDYFN